MSEWWTYRLSDFLMFSSRSYWRLIELTNRDAWPAHLLAILAGLVMMACIARPGKYLTRHMRIRASARQSDRPSRSFPRLHGNDRHMLRDVREKADDAGRSSQTAPGANARRIVLLLLGAGWAWVGWAYHLQRYADINTAGPSFAAAFAVQALLLWSMAFVSGAPTAAPLHRWAGLGIAGLAVLAYPLLALAGGRGWSQVEVAGLVPDPTVVATLGALLALRARWFAWLIPVAWCAVSGATLMELHIGHAWLLPVFAVICGAIHLTDRRRHHLTAIAPEDHGPA